MSPTVFSAVIAAAAMHAIWNAMVKAHHDRFVSITVMTLGMAAPSFLLIPFVAFPEPQVWLFIAISTFFHQGYKLSLIRGYAAGDFAQVYPIARGVAPLFTTLGAITLLAEVPSSVVLLGILVLCSGTLLMSFRGGQLRRLHVEATGFALLTAIFIACYTLSDGSGARAASSATSYAVWLYISDGIVSLLLGLILRRRKLWQPLLASWRAGLLSGLLSAGAYWIAMWAMTRAPVGMVAALRETSILFALMISVLFLRERLDGWRAGAGMLIVAGVIILRLG